MQLFVEQLTVIDSSYIDPQHGLVGESWICDVTLGGDPDDQSMIMDFGHVKKQLKQEIDGTLDHVLLVPAQMPGLERTEKGWKWQDAQGRDWLFEGPDEAVQLLECDHISDRALTQWLEAHLRRIVPANVREVQVELHHEVPRGPYYHYSHGLKKHDGNCQRIAHGHRSTVWVRHNGQDSPQMAQQVAQWLNYRYVISREDIAAQTQDAYDTRYHAPQGDFRLCVPHSAAYLLDSDSTVECITRHLAQRLQAEHGGEVTVRACEGVHKGAVFTAG